LRLRPHNLKIYKDDGEDEWVKDVNNYTSLEAAIQGAEEEAIKIRIIR
jgi:hypothetical protein